MLHLPVLVALKHTQALSQQLSAEVKYKGEETQHSCQRPDFSVSSQHREQTFDNSISEDKKSDYGFGNGEDFMFNICTAAAKQPL